MSPKKLDIIHSSAAGGNCRILYSGYDKDLIKDGDKRQ